MYKFSLTSIAQSKHNLQCEVEKQNDHFQSSKGGKEWVLVKFTAFNLCFLQNIK